MGITSKDLDQLVDHAKVKDLFEVNTSMTATELKSAGATRMKGGFMYRGIWLLPLEKK